MIESISSGEVMSEEAASSPDFCKLFDDIRHGIQAKLEELKIITDLRIQGYGPEGKEQSDSLFDRELESANADAASFQRSLLKRLVVDHLASGERLCRSGNVEAALDAWETVLKLSPENKAAHLWLHRIHSKPEKFLPVDVLPGMRARSIERAAAIDIKYRFAEDQGFMASLREICPLGPVRCIDFDPGGGIYLNDISKAIIVKLSTDGTLEWTVSAETWTQNHRTCQALGFGSFAMARDTLMVTDFRSRKLVFIEPDGEIARTVSLSLKNPSFAQYILSRNTYHIPDETSGRITIFDSDFVRLGEYHHQNESFRPVQILPLLTAGVLLATFGSRTTASRIEAFDFEGNHLFTFATFDDAPCHVVKLTSDEAENVYAADHYGKIYKFDRHANLIWSYTEKKRHDRFKYVKYHDSWLYVSDAFTLRRFRVK